MKKNEPLEMNKLGSPKRSSINRQLIVLGGLVLISGLFLLFHLESWLIKFVHEAGAILWLVALVRHLRLNRKALFKCWAGYLSPGVLAAIFTLGAALMAVSLL